MTKYLEDKGVSEEQFNMLKKKAEDKQSVVFSIHQVVERQKSKTVKAKEFLPCPDEEKGRWVQGICSVLDSLKGLQCSICSLPGHQSSYCWLNGQVWARCRNEGEDAQKANFLWRESIKLRRQAKEEAFKLHIATQNAAHRASQRVNMRSYKISRKKKNLVDARKYVQMAIKRAAKAQVAKEVEYFVDGDVEMNSNGSNGGPKTMLGSILASKPHPPPQPPPGSDK